MSIKHMSKNIGLVKFVSILLASAFVQSLTAQSQIDGFEEKYFDSSEGTILPYRIHNPSSVIVETGLPLIVYLHGSGGNGTDNVKQISGGNEFGTHL
jgi:predicted peptidase